MSNSATINRASTAAYAAVLALSAAALCLLSLTNHLLFRTYGLDLGIYTKAAYDYANLRVNDCSFFLWRPSSILADHFDLMLALLSPLVRLGGAWALLAVQIVAVLAGEMGIYRLARHRGASTPTALMLMPLPLLTFGTWHALGFDYHSNVVGAMLLPWLALCVERRRWWPAAILSLLIAICKESSALWLAFVLAAMMIGHWRERTIRRPLSIMLAATAVYLAVVMLVVMPSLGGSSMGFWRYRWMGDNFGQVAAWLVTHPLDAVRNLFVDFTRDADCGHLKREFFVCFLLSGGVCCLLKPKYLIMLLPPLALKMLSADPTNFWGLTFHYNVELCIVACVATVEVVCSLKGRWPLAASAVALLLTAGTLFYSTDRPLSDIRRAHVNILCREHYRMYDINTRAARRMLRQIPPRASVCATTMFTPHLAARDSVYLFPLGTAHNAEYYLIRGKCWSYYDGDESLATALIADTAHYTLLDSSANLYLLRRTGR